MPRRRHKGDRTRTWVSAADSELRQSDDDDKIDFDPDKLSMLQEGQWKSFSEWTLEYARHYYPEAGRKTYRVPPVDFNTQVLSEDSVLGFAELKTPKEEIRKKDRSQADVGIRLEELGHHLERAPDGGGQDQDGRGLFIVGSAHYDNYLSDLKSLRTRGSKLPPLPKEVAQRGEVDFMALHSLQGIILVQVKGVGLPDSWTPTPDDLKAAVLKRVREARGQLSRDVAVLRHVMGDLDLTCDLHTVVALPFVGAQLLQASLAQEEGEEEQGNVVYLCAEHMSSRKAMISWWETLIVREDSTPLTDLQLQSIVGRYCGLLSTVAVWCRSSLRIEVRDVAEAAEEVGARFASLVLTARQREVLDCPRPLVFLHGPPGTGKSVLLVIKARQWLLRGHDVVVLNVDFGRAGNPVGHYIHDGIRRWRSKVLEQRSSSEPGKKSAGKSRSPCGDGERCCGRGGGNVFTDSSDHSAGGDSSEAVRGSLRKLSTTTTTTDEEYDSPPVAVGPAEPATSGTKPGEAPTRSSAGPRSGTVEEEEEIGRLGQPFLIDFDLGLDADPSQARERLQTLLGLVQGTVRPGVPCHFLVDEFYWKERLVPVVELLRERFPASSVWCAEVGGERVPEGFTPFMLTTVLRCPPSVQAVLQRTDWAEGHRALYAGDSTLQGLPTDGFRPTLLEHRPHPALSPLDCARCADSLLDFFRQELKLDFGREGSHPALSPEGGDPRPPGSSSPGPPCRAARSGSGGQHLPTQPDGKKSLLVPKSKRKKSACCLPRRVRFSDVMVIFSYPQRCLSPADSDLLLIKDQLQDLHHRSIHRSVFFGRLREAGLPVAFRAPNSDAREIALPTEDRVVVSVTSAVTGLERKVVVYVPCESTAYRYPLSADLHPPPSSLTPPRSPPPAGEVTPSGRLADRAAESHPKEARAREAANPPQGQDAVAPRPQKDPLAAVNDDHEEEAAGPEDLHSEQNGSSGRASTQKNSPAGEGDSRPTLARESQTAETLDKPRQGEGEEEAGDDHRPTPPDDENEDVNVDGSKTPGPVSSKTTRPFRELAERGHVNLKPHPEDPEDGSRADLPEGKKTDVDGTDAESASPVTAGLSEEDWAKIDDRLLQQNRRGLFYAASRCLSVFVLIVP